ncbi:MAG: hypothetical protein ACREP2_00515 [Rhodanobacteraceae bacterium]
MTAAFAATAMAASHGPLINGSVQSVGSHSVTVNKQDGSTVKVKLDSNTKYVWVVKSSLSKIDKDSYVGAATTNRNGKLVAQEVVIFPESMRGAGEGHYAWGNLPAMTQSGNRMDSGSMTNGNVTNSKMTNGMVTNSKMTNGTVTNSSMTNGNVADSAMTNGTVTNSSMTNGNVASASGQSGGKQITVSYHAGQKTITVPPNAPIVAFEAAQESAITQGAKVFIEATKSHGQLVAKMVAVGKNGLTPPM